MERPQPHVAIFSTPGKGHLIPLIELAGRLSRRQGFAVTVIVPDDGSPLQPRRDLLQTVPEVNPVFLPPVGFDDLPADATAEARIALTVIRSVPALCRVLGELNEPARLSAYVADLFGSFTFESVRELNLNVPVYIFYTSPAMALSFAFQFPELDEPTNLTSVGSVLDLILCSDQDEDTKLKKLLVEVSKKFMLAKGVLVNSFLELEPDAFKALEEAVRSGARPPVYPVGPLIRSGSGTGKEHDCLEWLDKQPEQSVLYVAFGSGGTLSSGQLKELASGLEMSEQRFLLVARKPNDKVRNAAYFMEDKMNPSEYLPNGFMERTKGKGFVVQNWAPQVEVLRHPAVGGFLMHCGWNSVLESVVHGVPVIAWPLFAEQGLNAGFLSEGVKVAMKVREDENGMVDCTQIAGLVRRLIQGEEGEELRGRMATLKLAAAARPEDASPLHL